MSQTTVQELIDRLSEFDPDAVVQVAIQPSYPLTVSLRGVTSDSERGEEMPGNSGEQPPEGLDTPDVVWLVTSSSAPYGVNPYAPKELWDTASI